MHVSEIKIGIYFDVSAKSYAEFKLMKLKSFILTFSREVKKIHQQISRPKQTNFSILKLPQLVLG